VTIVLISGCLNLLEASGLLQACNGIALQVPHLTFTFNFTSFHTVLLSYCKSVSDIRCGRYWYRNVIFVGAIFSVSNFINFPPLASIIAGSSLLSDDRNVQEKCASTRVTWSGRPQNFSPVVMDGQAVQNATIDTVSFAS